MRRLVVCLVAIAALASASTALADFPYLPTSGGNAHDPTTFKVPPGEVPTNLNGDWKFAATPEISAQSTTVDNQADELCGVRGASIADAATTQPPGSCVSGPVHTAWNVTTGRPDVLIAVLDSGIEWNDPGAMTALADKVHLNQGELPAPNHNRTTALVPGVDCSTYKAATGGDYNPAGNYDVNDDGVFNILDYACDDRVSVTEPGRHGPPGVLTPEDLILAFSDGVDHDHNGFVNDIAGWDFVDNDNNPYDDVQYAHGTGEAKDSNGEAYTDAGHSGSSLGTCPNCMVMPLRVGESFIADVNRFAQAVLYATDSNALVIQEALGTLNNSTFARAAVDYAYNHGTVVIASAADEAAEHHNQPGALPHTITVNSVRNYDTTFTDSPHSYLQFNGCTNFGTKVTLSVPSTSCSSEATGKSAGVAGLIYSAALNAVAAHKLTPSTDCTRPDGSACVITPNEVRQLMASGDIGSSQPADAGNGGQADDVDFGAQPDTKSCTPLAAPSCTDPNSFTWAADQNGGTVLPLANSHRYPARKGFDEFYGYGRLNAYRAVSAAGAGNIPPEAEITSPDWFQQIDPSLPTLAIGGHVFARGQTYTCRVDVAPGGEPNNGLTTDTPPGDFKPVSNGFCDGSSQHSGAFDGTLATVDLTDLESRFPASNVGSFNGREPGLAGAQDSNGRPNTMPYAFTVRVVVTTVGATPTMTGEDRRQLFLHRDQDMLNGFPREMQTDGASSPLLVDLDGDNRNELVVATSDGVIHAYRPDGSELPGWPVHTDPLPLHTGERAYASGGISTDRYGAVLGGLAAGDLFHNGSVDVVADDNDGKVYAWDASGHLVFKQEANPAFDGNPATSFERQGPRDRVEHGFFAGPVLANLNGDPEGPLDIIAAGEDRHLYAWHPDGSTVTGFPVLLVDPDKVQSVAPGTDHVTFNAAKAGTPEDQGKIVDEPAVAQLDGSQNPPSIVVGSNEEYVANSGDEGPINAAGVSSSSLSVLGQVLGTFGNSRVYVVKHDGNASGHPFRAGWPKKVGQIDQQLLPDVGEGITGPPVVGDVPCQDSVNGSGPKIGVIPDAGPGYLFNPDGSSCYGSSNGQDTPLSTDVAVGAGKYDTPAFPAVGNPAFGAVGPGGQIAFLAPAAGLMRAADVLANEYQPGQDFLAAWTPQTGQFQPGWPSPMNDLQFLTGPAIGDITGLPVSQQAAVEGSASLDLAAINSAGAPASPNWPKLTGDWTVATPTLGSFGTLDTDPAATKDVVSLTRMGTLAVYRTPAAACSPSSWPRYHHDDANSGDLERDATPPGRIDDIVLGTGQISFTAPGNDLMCGTVGRYEVRGGHGQTIPGPSAPLAAAGATQTIALPNDVGPTVTIWAVDPAGNRGRGVQVDLSTGAVTVLGPGAASAAPARGRFRPGGSTRAASRGCLNGPFRVRSHGRRLGPVRLGEANRSVFGALAVRRHGHGILTACVQRTRRVLVIGVTHGHVVFVGTRAGVRGTPRPGQLDRRVHGDRRVRGVVGGLVRHGGVYAVLGRRRVNYVFVTSIRNRRELRTVLRRSRL